MAQRIRRVVVIKCSQMCDNCNQDEMCWGKVNWIGIQRIHSQTDHFALFAKELQYQPTAYNKFINQQSSGSLPVSELSCRAYICSWGTWFVQHGGFGRVDAQHDGRLFRSCKSQIVLQGHCWAREKESMFTSTTLLLQFTLDSRLRQLVLDSASIAFVQFDVYIVKLVKDFYSLCCHFMRGF